MKDKENSHENRYTRKINIPHYECTGKVPVFSEVYDCTKTNELIERILQEEMNEELRDFLVEAAHRHTVFNYKRVAELYAHSPLHLKKFFEDSGLVIVDYNDSIKNGFFAFQQALDESIEELLQEENL